MTVPSVSAAEYTFGSLGGEPIISAQSAIKAFAEKAGQGWSMSRFAGKANLFRTSIGFDHGSGCVLMARNRLDLLSTSEPLTLVLGSGSSGESVDLEGIYIRRAERIAPGASQSDDALYLVELVDSRYKLNRKRVNKRYNCRVPRSTADSYITETLNGGTPWTWEEIIQDLWGSCDSAIIGSYEKRPSGFDLSDLTSVPENLRYEGVSAWSALNDVVARVGCAVVHDNISAVNFYLIRLGRLGNSGVGGVECNPPMWNQGGPGSLCGTSYSAGPTDRGQYTVDTSGDCPAFDPVLDDDDNPVTGGDSLVSDDEILWGDITLPEYVVVWFPTEYGAAQLTDELKGLGKWYPVAVKVSDGTILPNDSIAADWYANPNSDEGRVDGRMTRPDFNPDTEIFRYETMTARFTSVAATEPANNDDCLNRAKEIARDLYRCLFDFSPMHITYAGVKFWAGDANQYIPGKSISEVVWSDLGGGIRTDIYRRLPRLMPESPSVLAQPGSVSGSCDCCPPCCGTLWKVVNDEIVWSVDFYEGLTQTDIDNWYSTGGPAPIGTTCDIDSNGNVYHTGDRFSRKLVTSLSRPQPAMYSLKSYDSNGNLNWSYAKYPNGFVSGGVRANDYGTTKVRCGGANVFSAYAGLTGSDCYLIRHNTSTGVPIWDINATAIERGYGDANVLIGAGPTRILLTGYGTATTHYPIIVLDHDGNFVWGEQTNTIEPVWIDDNDVQYGIDRIGTTPDGDKVASWDADGTFLNVPIIRDGFQPLRLRTLGDQLVCSNGTEIRLYTINGTGNYTQKITSTESLMVFSDRVGSKTEFITRLRSATDLSTAYFFYPPTTNSVGDDYLFSDAMPFEGGTVWCGRRVCGKTLEPDTDTPTTTSTTTTSTSTTTGSTTTASTTSTTTASTTTSSTTTASTTTGSTTTSSTTTDSTTTASTTTGSTTTGSTSSTTAACTGNCDYAATAIGTGSPTGFYWFLATSNCSSGCGCVSGDFETATAIGRWPADINDTASITCR